MPGTITPLPVFEQDQEEHRARKPLVPDSLVVRYGYLRRIAELPYSGDTRPSCGGKVVIRTNDGIAMAEMITTTCANSGCNKTVSRSDMLSYIDKSGGKDYPFTNQGKILRIATRDDLDEQAKVDARKPEAIKIAKQNIREMNLPMNLVDVEMLLGGERIIFYYTAEKWVDFRELVRKLASELQTRIEMHQVNAREEARLVADYEKCGQHCCCKQFLKVLKPVSMRSAKVQKATLDPQKISGRCGRLMCCLRYEDQTYTELRKNLPGRKSYVETDDGIGIVLDTQILTQLALVRIGANPPAAYPVENIRVLNTQESRQFKEQQLQQEQEQEQRRSANGSRPGGRKPRPQHEANNKTVAPPSKDQATPSVDDVAPNDAMASGPRGTTNDKGSQDKPQSTSNHRRRRRKRRGGGGSDSSGDSTGGDGI
jgi:cell fate regulator YaaT (PSP1 superfamily)